MMQGPQKNDCDAWATNSQGCGVRSKSKVSYGPACESLSVSLSLSRMSALCRRTRRAHSRLSVSIDSQQEEGWCLRASMVFFRDQNLFLASKVDPVRCKLFSRSVTLFSSGWARIDVGFLDYTKIKSGHPKPSSKWGTPHFVNSASSCNPFQRFSDLMLVINTNLCGTWATGTWGQSLSYAGQSQSPQDVTGHSS